jgi:hypothetical protein
MVMIAAIGRYWERRSDVLKRRGAALKVGSSDHLLRLLLPVRRL